MDDNLFQRMRQDIIASEGSRDRPYKDTNNILTAGYGFNVGTKAEFVKLPFWKKDATTGALREADNDEKAKDFDRIKNKSNTELATDKNAFTLTYEYMKARLDMEITTRIAAIKKEIGSADWDKLTDGQKVAVLDIHYANGNSLQGFPSLKAAIRAHNAEAMAAQAGFTGGTTEDGTNIRNWEREARNQANILGVSQEEGRRAVLDKYQGKPHEKPNFKGAPIAPPKGSGSPSTPQTPVSPDHPVEPQPNKPSSPEEQIIGALGDDGRTIWTNLKDPQRTAVLAFHVRQKTLSPHLIAAIRKGDAADMVTAMEAQAVKGKGTDWAWLAGIETTLLGMDPIPVQMGIWGRHHDARFTDLPGTAVAELAFGTDFWGKLGAAQKQAILTLIGGATLKGTDLIPLLASLYPKNGPAVFAKLYPKHARDVSFLTQMEAEFFHLPLDVARSMVLQGLPGMLADESSTKQAIKRQLGADAWKNNLSPTERQALVRLARSNPRLPEALVKAIRSGQPLDIALAMDAAFGTISTDWASQAEMQKELRGVSIEEARQMIMLRHPNAQFGGQTPAPWNPSKGDPWAGANPAEAPKESLMETILRGAADVLGHLNPFSVSPAYGAEVVPPTLSGTSGASAGPANSDSPAVPAAINAGSGGGGAGAGGLPGQRVGMNYAGAPLPSWSAAAAMEALVEPPHAPEPPHKPGATASGHGRLSMLLPYDLSADAEAAQRRVAGSAVHGAKVRNGGTSDCRA